MDADDGFAAFNPAPRIQRIPLYEGHQCLVVDDLLADPAAWISAIRARHQAFRPTGHAYPGVELWFDEAHTAAIAAYFAARVMATLGLAEVLNAASRASLVTLAPERLAPMQRICHRDDRGVPAGEAVAASVLYLFDDPALGGTSFYRPRRPPAEIAALIDDSRVLRNEAFDARHPGFARGYMLEGNDWFDRVATVPARCNRALFYDGGIFHSGDIRHPERLSADPARGRLTINSFLRCRRRVAPVEQPA